MIYSNEKKHEFIASQFMAIAQSADIFFSVANKF